MSKVRKFRHLVLEISFFWIIPLNNYKNTSSGFSRGTESIGCCYYFPSFYPKKQTFCLRLLGRISLPSVGQAFLLLHAHIFTLCIAGVTWVEGTFTKKKGNATKKKLSLVVNWNLKFRKLSKVVWEYSKLNARGNF